MFYTRSLCSVRWLLLLHPLCDPSPFASSLQRTDPSFVKHLTVLLFVFWYCHKRGREVRLEKERLLTEAEVDALNKADSAQSTSTSDPPTAETSPPLTTTAPVGAPLEEVQAGLHHHPDDGDDAPEQEDAPYAEGGSLAKELKREREEAAAAKANAKAEEGEKP